MLVTVEAGYASGTPLRFLRAQILDGYRSGTVDSKVEESYVSAHFIECSRRHGSAVYILIERDRRLRVGDVFEDDR